MNEIIFLGTGGAAATLERDNTSLLLRRNEDLVLVDCPGSVTRKIKSMGLDPRNLRALQVTHVHPDHIYGLPSLVHSLMLDDMVIRVTGAEESLRFCRDLLDLFHLREDTIRCRCDFIPLESEESFEVVPGVTCRAFPVPHKDSSLAFHWRFEAPRKDVMYSGDTPLFPPLFKRAAGIDVLIHDCSIPSRFFEEYPFLPRMHTNALDLGRMAQEAGVKTLVPCHFFGELPYEMDEVEGEIRRYFQGETLMPRDLMRLELGALGVVPPGKDMP
jgi:ribonuclease Z